MSRAIEIHAEAVEELDDAVAWYEAQRPGLGGELLAEIERVIATIAMKPLAYPQWLDEDPARRALATRFPYGVFFDAHPERVVILAMAHSRRRPRY